MWASSPTIRKRAEAYEIQNNFFIAVGLGNCLGFGQSLNKIILNLMLFMCIRDNVSIVPYNTQVSLIRQKAETKLIVSAFKANFMIILYYSLPIFLYF